MQINIKDSNKLCDASFIQWLIPRIRAELSIKILSSKFDAWDDYFNKVPELARVPNVTKTILLFAANHLDYKGAEGDMLIYINKMLHVPQCPSRNLEATVRQITYGSLGLKGCPVFKTVFEDIQSNIELYLSEFYQLEY